MNLKKIVSVSSVIALSLGVALPAFAQGAYGTIDSQTQGTVNLGTVRVGATSSASASGDVKVGASGGGGTSGVSGSGSASGGIRVQTGDVNGDGAAGLAATGTVHGDPDFDLAIKAQSSENNVTVTAKQPVKLFGFIPLTAIVIVDVDADGQVDVRFPWWTFLAVTNKADIQARVESAVKAFGAVTAREASTGKATGKLSAGAQAELIAGIKSVLQTQVKADASASGSASVH